MIGTAPTILDITLQELPPEPVCLLCEETFQEEEEEHRYIYKIYITCGVCHCRLKLYVQGPVDTLRLLQRLLIETLDIVCPTCGRRSD